jgi:3(or 17)beta-hydroxysteroid dehydrogenase
MQAAGRVQDKVAVVTGAASGIGLAIAQLFAAQGAHVVLTDIDAVAVASKITTLSTDCEHLGQTHDVSNEPDWERVLDAAIAKFGRIDILVNNAGIAAEGAIEDVTLEAWRRVMSVNLDGTFLGCKHAVRRMKQNVGGGAIVNMSSVGALKASLTGPAYGASKAGVWNLSRTVALYCARNGYNIRCNSLHPGLTQTPMMDRASPEMIDRLKAGIPLGRLAESVDIAQAALYLASDEARYTTGTSLVVDGGYTT